MVILPNPSERRDRDDRTRLMIPFENPLQIPIPPLLKGGEGGLEILIVHACLPVGRRDEVLMKNRFELQYSDFEP